MGMMHACLFLFDSMLILSCCAYFVWMANILSFIMLCYLGLLNVILCHYKLIVLVPTNFFLL